MALLYLPDADTYIRTEGIDMLEPEVDSAGELLSVSLTRTGSPWVQEGKTDNWNQLSDEYTGQDAKVLIAWADMEALATKSAIARSQRQMAGHEVAVDISKRMVRPTAVAVTVTEPVDTGEAIRQVLEEGR